MVQGQRMKLTRWIHSGPCVLRVEVDAVIPDADPSEPCLEPDTVRLLDRLQQLADEGRVEELERYGEVYIRRSA